MIVSRRLLAIVVATILTSSFLFFNSRSERAWRYLQDHTTSILPSDRKTSNFNEDFEQDAGDIPRLGVLPELEPQPVYFSGTAKPPGSNYTRTLVIARVANEDVAWIGQELPGLQTAIYTADDPTSPLHPPMNKGHEVMIYLTYIIDHYDVLPDVSIFMHAHRWSWHNNDLSGAEAVQMIQSLSNERVFREGYMNLRCHWEPGCPDWMRPRIQEADLSKQEQMVLGLCWSELFPDQDVPEVLAQPCCAQFALSKERIQSIPFKRFVAYRDWLLRTPLSDYMSGRVWEYIWQFVFTGKHVACPPVHECFCDGFGFCFGGEEQYAAYRKVWDEKEGLRGQLDEWNKLKEDRKKAEDELKLEELAKLDVPEEGKDALLKPQIEDLERRIKTLKLEAQERGKDPKNRALEAGRRWEEGDGY